MVERVHPDEIERIVGRARHLRAHYGRAVSAEQKFYILHSQICLEDDSIMNCMFSMALARGIDMDEWGDLQDRPVLLQIEDGRLVPGRIGYP